MKLDFRTKLLLTIVVGVVVIEGSLVHNYYYLGMFLCFLPYIFALVDKRWSMLIKGVIANSIAIVGNKYLLILPQNIRTMILNLYCGITMSVLPGFMMGYYTISTTTMSDLVYALKKIKFPDYIIIPISVMFRFFYSIKEDYQKINEAIYMHGLTAKNFFKDPARILEYKFVPLLMITSQTADNVSISAMTRGMKVGCERSSISNTRLKFFDYVFLVFSLLLIILFIRGKYARI